MRAVRVECLVHRIPILNATLPCSARRIRSPFEAVRVREAVANVEPWWRTADRRGEEENCLDDAATTAERNRRDAGSLAARVRVRSDDEAKDDEESMVVNEQLVRRPLP